MDLSIKNTTKKQRREIAKTAFLFTTTNSHLPSQKAINLIKEYIDGISEIEDVQNKIIAMYKKENK